MRKDSQKAAEAAYLKRQEAAKLVKVGVRVPESKRAAIIQAAREMREEL